MTAGDNLRLTFYSFELTASECEKRPNFTKGDSRWIFLSLSLSASVWHFFCCNIKVTLNSVRRRRRGTSGKKVFILHLVNMKSCSSCAEKLAERVTCRLAGREPVTLYVICHTLFSSLSSNVICYIYILLSDIFSSTAPFAFFKFTPTYIFTYTSRVLYYSDHRTRWRIIILSFACAACTEPGAINVERSTAWILRRL